MLLSFHFKLFASSRGTYLLYVTFGCSLLTSGSGHPGKLLSFKEAQPLLKLLQHGVLAADVL